MAIPVALLAPLLSATVTGTLGIIGTFVTFRWNERRKLQQTGEVSTVSRLQAQIKQERKDCATTQRYLRAQIITWQGDAQNAWAAVQRLLDAANKLDPVNAAELIIGQRMPLPDNEEAE